VTDLTTVPVTPGHDDKFDELAIRWRDLWNTDPMRMVDEVYADDTSTGAPMTVRFRTREQLRVIETIFVEAAPRKRMELVRTVREANVVVVECTIYDDDRPNWSVALCALLTLDLNGQIINDTSFSEFAAWPSVEGGMERMLAAGAEFADASGFVGAIPNLEAPLTTIPPTKVGTPDFPPVIQRWADLWNNDPISMVDELYSPAAVGGIPGWLSTRGHEQFKIVGQIILDAAPKRRLAINRAVTQGSTIAVETILTDADRPGWMLPLCAVLTFENNLIVNDTSYVDTSQLPATLPYMVQQSKQAGPE
jgi:hypothetical protein